jgi:protein tyrosine/serine phosphatase
VVFANFREVTVGKIRKGVLYRAASPCDNQHNRAPYTDRLIKKVKVVCILDLADDTSKIEKYIAKDDFDSPYFLELYREGKVIPLSLSMNFYSTDFTDKLTNGLRHMAEMEGPYFVHCTEGKDRTGFVCMLLEALCGASYDEIVDDYMITYDNYYKINPKEDNEKYVLIRDKNLIPMIKTMVGDDSVDIKTADLSKAAYRYLLDAEMTEEEIDGLIGRLCR